MPRSPANSSGCSGRSASPTRASRCCPRATHRCRITGPPWRRASCCVSAQRIRTASWSALLADRKENGVAESSDRVALPIRVHDFLLTCAGRIDDDALTDARELLAVAELDRAVDLLTASLVAGRIPMSADERDELRDLVHAVRSSPALVDRVIVN